MTGEQLALQAAAPHLADALVRIYNADASRNNGAFMGEAVLCRAFSVQARDALRAAGLMLPGGDYARAPQVQP